jgi:flagellar L-ring protein precursor FlgH
MRLVLILIACAGCTRLEQVGRAPGFSALEGSNQHHAMYSAPLPRSSDAGGPSAGSSLWSSERGALFSDRRAAQRGDILTVVIEIDESARISNTTSRGRDAGEEMSIPALVGLPQRIDQRLPEGASMAEAADLSASSTYRGTGSVSRNERLLLRIAATVVEELPNGVLRVEGQQEVRVNNELRELLLTGYVRPIDISRKNEITYDKIAGARISYGGRGQISDVQQPRYGQQIADILLPF